MNFIFEWPQITYVCLIFLGLLIGANRHGKPKKSGIENFYSDVFASSIGWSLLYFGGFFTK